MSNRLRARTDRLDIPGIFIPGSKLTPPEPPERPGRPEPVHLHITITLPPGFPMQPRRRAGAGLGFWIALALILWSVLA